MMWSQKKDMEFKKKYIYKKLYIKKSMPEKDILNSV